MLATYLAEQRILPDSVVRAGIRHIIKGRLESLPTDPSQYMSGLVTRLSSGPIAEATTLANEQHYEVPAQFFKYVLGKRLKYSCGYWPEGVTTLDAAEEAALDLVLTRADIQDGMEVLDVGCGWGSLSLFIAEKFPKTKVTAISNSHSQRLFIESRAQQLGLDNVRALTRNISTDSIEGSYDRITSVEMFEHMRNYQALFSKLGKHLKSDGKMFIHVFCHKKHAYTYENESGKDWMARHFFTGGVMPSRDLLPRFHAPDNTLEQWFVSGIHYAKTCRAWLQNLDTHDGDIRVMLSSTGYTGSPRRWIQRWRMFIMACEELFDYDRCQQWGVGHYLFSKPSYSLSQ